MAARPVHSTAAPAPRGLRPIADEERADALWDMERSLRRRGFTAVAGADEAGRGACAGPLVAAACVLPSGKRGRVPGLADSKLLTAAARERVYAEILDRAVSWSVVRSRSRSSTPAACTSPTSRPCAGRCAPCDPEPDYVLTDGFPVPGLARPGLAVWKGDRVAACVAAASVLAKVTRDRDDGRAARTVAGVRLRRPQGLHHRRAHRRPGAARALSGAPDALRQRGAGARPARRAGPLRLPGDDAMHDDGDMRPVSCEPPTSTEDR